MNRLHVSIFALLFLVAGCPEPTEVAMKDQVPATSLFLEACNQYNRLLHCESVLTRERLQSFPCTAVQDAYELSCSSEEIGYAREMFTKNADACWQIVKAKGKNFTRNFDMSSLSEKCLKAEHR